REPGEIHVPALQSQLPEPPDPTPVPRVRRHQTFGTNSKLRIHRLRVHEKTPTHFCPLCDYSSYLQNDITRHVNSCHHGELNFGCSRCEARFSSETALKQHVLRRHEEKVSYGCPRCSFVCHSEATLKCHVQKQHPHLECSTCKETFATREALEEHKTQHFSHRCELCSFAAKERQQLVRHYMESHEPARSFICEQCGKAFKTRFLLKTHLKKHSEEKPYVCNACGRAFRWAAGLRHHYLTHTNEHPFFCRYCPYKAKQKFQVIKHIQRHHPEHGAVDPSQGVGKDPSTHTVHLHSVQRESQAKGPRMEQEGECPTEKDGTSQ
uniref:Zinc finger protein 142 n=1 Tax=Malurus cyaneus samueli TaxID=2593467 RepID=A0A8C5X719_9PASS